MNDVYLEELRDKLLNKDLDNFWIACYKTEYKPLKISKDELLDTINKNINKYVDKHFANIKIGIKKNIKNYDINHKEIFVIRIIIYTIDNKGKFKKDDIEQWGSVIKYDLFDLLENKFTLKDLYIIVRATYDRILWTDGVNGISYNEMIKKLNKNKISI